MALALSEFCTASLSSAIAGEGEAFGASFGPGAGVAAFCACGPVCEQAEHTNTRIVKSSFIPFRDGSRNQNCSVFCGFSAADNRCSSQPLDAGRPEKANWGLLIFWSGADLADGIDQTGRHFRETLRGVLTSDTQLTGTKNLTLTWLACAKLTGQDRSSVYIENFPRDETGVLST